MPSSPALSRTKRALRRAAGRSGGVFERVPGSNKPYHFRYVKPEGHQSTLEGPTRDQRPTATSSLTSTSPGTTNSSIKEPETSDSSEPHAASTAMASSAHKPAASTIALTDDDEDTETSSLASSELSEYTIASHEQRKSVIHRSIGSLRERVRDSALGTSIEQLLRRHEALRSRHARAPGATVGVESDAGGKASAAEARADEPLAAAGRRERASRFFEHLGGGDNDETESSTSTAGLLRESEKATRRFFGLEPRKGRA